MNQTARAIVILAVLLFSWQSGWCSEADKEEKVYAVQNRVFHRNHEIGIYGGYIADDDFFHAYPIGVGYTYHFNEHVSWEVLRAQYMFTTEKDLKQNLEQNFGVTPEQFPEPQYMYHSHFVFKPLYGKSAFMNRSIVNNEIYLFAGPGVVSYEWKYSTGETRSEDALSLSLGVGMRFFLSQRYCLNVEIRDLVNFREDKTQNNLYFGLGFGYRFNFAPRKVEQDPTVEKLKTILDQGK